MTHTPVPFFTGLYRLKDSAAISQFALAFRTKDAPTFDAALAAAPACLPTGATIIAFGEVDAIGFVVQDGEVAA